MWQLCNSLAIKLALIMQTSVLIRKVKARVRVRVVRKKHALLLAALIVFSEPSFFGVEWCF